MKTLEHSSIFIDSSLDKVVEHRNMCINNARMLMKHNKKVMFIDSIEKIHTYYVLIFKIVPRNRYTVKEYERLRSLVDEHYWTNYIDETIKA